MSMTKYVYSFGGGKADGERGMRDLLGGKGANLAEMSRLGVPVPPGFTITTEVCTHYVKNQKQYPEGLEDQVREALAKMEGILECRFGDDANPLLVSVRSGAPVSMPGMMDTVLNLGLNDTSVQGLIHRTNNPRFAYDSYRRFVAMYGDVVLGLKPENQDAIDPFEEILEAKKHEVGVTYDHELSAEDLQDLVERFKKAVKDRLGLEFPDDPMQQIWGAIGAVFGSWNNARAIHYRRINRIPDALGTAVNVQGMVFGNTGQTSGTGVAFTRDPATGEHRFYGEYLMNAQGEDVVAGVRTPLPIDTLEEKSVEAYRQLLEISDKLERHFHDMLDLEFTIEEGRLWMLQARVGKRTGLAAIRMAVEMVEEGLIDSHEALRRLEPEQLNQLLQPVFNAKEKAEAVKSGKLLAKGIDAGPGAASGRVVFTASDAVEWAGRGETVLLVRHLTSPEDIAGMKAAQGILTAQGGKTSHAALVARQMGTVCVVGCAVLGIDYAKRQLRVGDQVVKEGDWLSIDGSTGEVLAGRLDTTPSAVVDALLHEGPKDEPAYRLYNSIMSWADEVRTLKVRTNADQPGQSSEAIAFGAEGIGLCRTEHMFFGEDRIMKMRRMILAADEGERRDALEGLRPLQQADFEGIFRVMNGRPVTIRLLDPPLHEFLPHDDDEVKNVARALGIEPDRVRDRSRMLSESNPMLGHRGCRLGISYPEIYEMQVRAIIEAAATIQAEGIKVLPEIMIPLVGHSSEMALTAGLARRVADEVLARGVDVKYQVGTMIELPRACLVADTIAANAEFFSFGTNDLTQTTYGLSRDDIGSFLPHYLNTGLYKTDPFGSIDEEGMGQLMRLGVEKGRRARPDLKIGICGEHGGDPSSVIFCHNLGLDYVSCSPYRVPIARLAAAQAALADARVPEPVAAS